MTAHVVGGWLGGHAPWAMVSTQPAVMGCPPNPAPHFRGFSSMDRASLFSEATAAGPWGLPHPLQRSYPGAKRGSPCLCLIHGWAGLHPWLATGPGCWTCNRQWEGGQVSQVSRVRGTQSLWGEGWEQEAIPETPGPFAAGPTFGGVNLKLSAGCGFCNGGLGPPGAHSRLSWQCFMG